MAYFGPAGSKWGEMSQGEMSQGEMSQGEMSHGEKRHMGRNVAGRNVAGRNVFWGETSHSPLLAMHVACILQKSLDSGCN